MQGCGYDMDVVAAVTRTFLVCVCLHQWRVGEEGSLTDWGLGRVCSLFRTGGHADKVC